MRVVLQPCADKKAVENLQKTIYQVLNLEDIKEYISDDEYKTLLNIYPNKTFQVWGTQQHNLKHWKNIKTGDIALFTADSKILYSATITYALYHEKLSEFFWQSKEFPCLYFIDEGKECNLSYKFIQPVILNFMLCSEKRSPQIVEYLDLESNRYFDTDIDEKKYENKLRSQFKKLENQESLDENARAVRRMEQGILRKYLFHGKYEAPCAICNTVLPVEFLWCSHIKKRSICTKEELVDYKNIATPMCKFGCDELYEKGYLGVRDGKVIILKESSNPFINHYLKRVENNECIGYQKDSQKYYDYHNENVK